MQFEKHLKRLTVLFLAAALLLPGAPGVAARADSPTENSVNTGENESAEEALQRRMSEEALLFVKEAVEEEWGKDAFGPEEESDLHLLAANRNEMGFTCIYEQYYRNVPIIGASIAVTVTDDEPVMTGIYYDVSASFGDDFEKLVKEARTPADWMESCSIENFGIWFDHSSLKPVIYVSKDDTAVVARDIRGRLQYELEDGTVESAYFEEIVSIDGGILYEMREIPEDGIVMAFDTTVSAGESKSLLPVRNLKTFMKGNVDYAYNEEYNFFVLKGTISDKNLNRTITDLAYYDDNQKNHTMKPLDFSRVYQARTALWSGARDEEILSMMQVYYDVLLWYDKTFGYEGLDGSGGLSALAVIDGGTLAANYSSILVLMQQQVEKAPEVLAHEICHSVIRSRAGVGGAYPYINESMALQEGVSDVFAALYARNWKLASATSSPKDIAGARNTSMDDYIYDSYVANEKYDGSDKEGKYGRQKLGQFIWGKFKYAVDGTISTFKLIEKTVDPPVKLFSHANNLRPKDGSSNGNKEVHENAFILSHTLYEVWKKAYNKDWDVFGQDLYLALALLNGSPDFGDLRDALLAVMDDETAVRKASECFDKAKIEGNDGSLKLRKTVQADLENARLSADGKAVYAEEFFANYKDTDKVCLADVTGDGEEEMIVVEFDEYGGINGRVYTLIGKGDTLHAAQIFTKTGSSSHAGGFFSWYLMPDEKHAGSYCFFEELDMLWQGYGSLEYNKYYLTKDGEVRNTAHGFVSSDSYGSTDDSGRISDEAYENYGGLIDLFLADCRILHREFTAGSLQCAEMEMNPAKTFAGYVK
ncbi:MAG: hypothetical protein IJH99_02540 [Eubacterium sp.]|nr:hypothetical protein [Eubacterium sp.]